MSTYVKCRMASGPRWRTSMPPSESMQFCSPTLACVFSGLYLTAQLRQSRPAAERFPD